MEEKSLSEKESLQLIAGMISQARNYYYESGLGELLWGFILRARFYKNIANRKDGL